MQKEFKCEVNIQYLHYEQNMVKMVKLALKVQLVKKVIKATTERESKTLKSQLLKKMA